jgi:hypothetical protein
MIISPLSPMTLLTTAADAGKRMSSPAATAAAEAPRGRVMVFADQPQPRQAWTTTKTKPTMKNNEDVEAAVVNGEKKQNKCAGALFKAYLVTTMVVIWAAFVFFPVSY